VSEIKVEELKDQARQLRQAVVAMLALAGSGHPASSLGSADLFAWLYGKILQHRPAEPTWEERDRFILSAGHLAPIWYATLAQQGYFKQELLLGLRKLGSPLQGHPHRQLNLGIENSAGPLGQGLSMAAGLAYGLKQQGGAQRVFVLSSDGEQNEGQVWEAYLFAAHYKLDNLIVLLDQNQIQQSGKTAEIMDLGNLEAKLLAFGFAVVQVDGNNFASLNKAWRKIEFLQGKPKALICRTIPGKGVKQMENNWQWHAKKIDQETARLAWQELEGKC
jgi:transketolase